MSVPSRSFIGISLFFIATCWIIGCGGSGGGSSTTGSTSGCSGSVLDGDLTYETRWTDAVGQSQVLRVINRNGITVGSQVINRTSEPRATFPSLDGGKYELRSELRSQPDGAGSVIRELRTEVEICGNLEVRADSGGVPNTIRVTPSTVQLTELDTKQIFASALTDADRFVLVPPDSFVWSITGTAATISSDGRLTAERSGTSTATARLSSSTLSGSCTVTVLPFNVRRGKWTILVFLNAANDLFQFSDQNVNQMERVAQNQDVRFVLQWKQTTDLFPTSSFNGTRRYLVTPDTTDTVTSQLLQDMGDGVDMGVPETLNEFVNWGKQYFPADRYVVVIWNHGNGWRRSPTDDALSRAVSYDDETGNAIQIWELGAAFGNHVFDIVAWDSSLMQMLEVAYEIRGNAKLIAGSEESPPGEGYPYDKVFQGFRDNPDATSASLSNGFVTGMLGVPEYATRKITQSVIDTSKLGNVASALNSFGNALIADGGGIIDQINGARNTSQAYSQTNSRYYRDIRDLISKLNGQSGVPASISSAGTALSSAVQAAIVHEGHNSNSPGSTGLSIDFSPAFRFLPSNDDYERMKIAQDTSWNEWLEIAP